MQTDKNRRYDTVAMVLHWAIAALMIFMIVFGEDLIRVSRDPAAAAAAGTFLPSLHVSIGIGILILSAVRLAWRLTNPPPPLPATMAPWEQMVSKLTHVLFYILLIGLPLSGWLSFGHYAVERPAVAGAQVFGLFPVPGAPDLGGIGGALHGLGSNFAMALVILHVLAALKHQFVNRDDILRRMLPL